MTGPLTIWIVGDGKPGHENQSGGLAEAIGRIVPVTIVRISLAGIRGWFARLRSTLRQAAALPAPDLILGAGHATHPSLLALARRTGAPCVVLMKPSLPVGLFDLCLVPAHDLGDTPPGPNVVATLGALNRVAPPPAGPRPGRLLLIGGPSANHGWDSPAMLDALGEILGGPGDGWTLTDSRRTPDDFLPALRLRFPGIAVFPHAETDRDWLPARLREAGEVWVTEDSVSMIYEALSSGARVGLLPVPRGKRPSRVVRGVDRLVEEEFVTPFARWRETLTLPESPRPLREADRCARLVLDRLFTHLS